MITVYHFEPGSLQVNTVLYVLEESFPSLVNTITLRTKLPVSGNTSTTTAFGQQPQLH